MGRKSRVGKQFDMLEALFLSLSDVKDSSKERRSIYCACIFWLEVPRRFLSSEAIRIMMVAEMASRLQVN